MKIVLTPEEKAAKKAAKKATWLASGIAMVQNPLKYIGEQLNSVVIENGRPVQKIHPVYTVMKRQAAKGNGSVVRTLALYIANGGTVDTAHGFPA